MKARKTKKQVAYGFCALIGLTLLTANVKAQVFHLGVKGGANMNKINGSSFNSEFKLGYQAGVFGELDFSKTFGIQPELLFNQTNLKTTNTASDIFHPGDHIHLNYLSIPVLLRVNTGRYLTFLAGPQYSVLINNHKTTLQNAGNAFSSGDFSLAMGLQLNLHALRVYGRYNIGLSDMGDIASQNKWNSQQLQLGVGLAIF